jgi:hypothetical protein
VTLAAEDVDAIAYRVVELLAEQQPHPATGLVDAASLARELGVSRAYVYDHADALGGIRLGTGPKARLRFDLARALAAHRPAAAPVPAPPATRPPRRPAKTPGRKVAVLKSRPHYYSPVKGRND